MKKDENEPDWMNPANDRKAPFTNEEIEEFVDGFILGLDEREWSAMKAELSEEKAREKIRAGMVKMDERNLINMSPEGPIN